MSRPKGRLAGQALPAPSPPGKLPLRLRLLIELAFLSAVCAIGGSLFLLGLRAVDALFAPAEALTVSQAMLLLVLVAIAGVFQGLYILALVVGMLAWRVSRGRELTQRERRRLVVSQVSGGAFLVVVVALLLLNAAGGCAEVPRTQTAFPVGVVYSRDYDISVFGFEKYYPFDVHKYEKIRDGLIRSGLMAEGDFLVPEVVQEEELLLVHTPEYLSRIRTSKEISRSLEFPAVKILPSSVARGKLLRPFEKATGGTILACRTALVKGVAFNLAGGYAHASADEGGGFNLLADIPVAIRVLQKEGRIRRALVVDCDVHQGQGTAREFSRDAEVVTFDIYNRSIYPFPKVPADVDLPVAPGTTGPEYLALLRQHLPAAIDKATPDLIVYVAGTDVYAGDALGGLRLSADDVLERDMYVIDTARSRGIPVAIVLSGGYSPESWRLHCNTIGETIRRHGPAGPSAP